VLDCRLDALKDLLGMWRLAVDAVEPKVVTAPVRSLLNRISIPHAAVAAAKGVHFEILQTCNVMVRSDPDLLGRMLESLVENAVRFTAKGRVWVDCAIEGSRLRIAVHDTGIGIPDGHIDRIWEEFHQVGNPHRGLGLGLAVVRRLSRVLDHPVSVSSAAGAGSVFTVSLPIESAQVFHLPGTAAHGGGTPKRRHARCAVLVDDDILVLLALAATFEDWGYDVLTAESADQAVERLEASGRTPDIVVVDYRLRDGHVGTDALLRIREKVGAPVPGIILTGENGPDCRRDAAWHGLEITLKPASSSMLQAAVERQISLGKRNLLPSDAVSRQGRVEGQG
jgi:two-component system, sensor histidine kinase